MKKLIAITAIVFVITTITWAQNRTYELKSENYTVESLGSVEVEITTPLVEIITLDAIDFAITMNLMQLESYQEILDEIVTELERLKTIRVEIKKEAEKVILLKGQEL